MNITGSIWTSLMTYNNQEFIGGVGAFQHTKATGQWPKVMTESTMISEYTSVSFDASRKWTGKIFIIIKN